MDRAGPITVEPGGHSPGRVISTGSAVAGNDVRNAASRPGVEAESRRVEMRRTTAIAWSAGIAPVGVVVHRVSTTAPCSSCTPPVGSSEGTCATGNGSALPRPSQPSCQLTTASAPTSPAASSAKRGSIDSLLLTGCESVLASVAAESPTAHARTLPAMCRGLARGRARRS